MTIASDTVVTSKLFDDGNERWQAAFRCDECAWLSIGSVLRVNGQSVANPKLWIQSQELVWFPQVGVGRDFEDVPSHIATAASEAYACLSIGALRAAGALARAVVEATAKEKGITKGQIHQKISALEEQKLVRPLIAEAAHEVRHLGNDMSHGDFVDPVELEEAQAVLQLMSEVLDEVFQTPARVARVRAAREAKKEQ